MNPPQTVHVIVCGGRDYSDQAAAYDALDAFHAHTSIHLLVHGAARGADTIAEQWADCRGVLTERVHADWETHGKSAGPIRNMAMLKGLLRSGGESFAVLAFPGGRGTDHMVSIAVGHKVATYRAIGREWVKQ